MIAKIFRGSKLIICKKLLNFASFDPCYKFAPQRRPQTCLSLVKNMIVQILITNDQEILCCDTTFGLVRGKIC